MPISTLEFILYPVQNVMGRVMRAIIWTWNRSTYAILHRLYYSLGPSIGMFWLKATANKSDPISWTDAWNLAMSAMTTSGLNTVEMHTLNTRQQVCCYLSFCFGSMPCISLAVTVSRVFSLNYFCAENAAEYLKWNKDKLIRRNWARKEEDRHQARPGSSNSWSSRLGLTTPPHALPLYWPQAEGSNNSWTAEEAPSQLEHESQTYTQLIHRHHSDHPHADEHIPLEEIMVGQTMDTATVATGQDVLDSWHAPPNTLQARNVHSPTPETPRPEPDPRLFSNSSDDFEGSNRFATQKRLCTEKNAVLVLACCMVLYSLFFVLPGIAINLHCLSTHSPEAQAAWDIGKVWLSIFLSSSAFANAEISPLDQNMVEFNTDKPMLAWMDVQMLAGKTCYAPFLLFSIFLAWVFIRTFRRATTLARYTRLRRWQEDLEWVEEALHFLITNPRQCSIHLLPALNAVLLLVFTAGLYVIDGSGFYFGGIGPLFLTGVLADSVMRG